MAGKIPVGATIAEAYRFAFGDFLTILGIVWLPMAITFGGGLLLQRPTMALSTALTTHDYASAAPVLGLLIPFYLVTFVLLFMQIAGVTEQALGLRRGASYYYFSLGKPVWRLIGAMLLLFLIVVAITMGMVAAAALITVIIRMIARATGPSKLWGIIVAISAFAGFVTIYCAYIYTIMRMSFLLNPVVIAEKRIGIKRAWALGRGNFWRMLAIFLSFIVPFLILEAIFFFGFLLHGLPPMTPPHATPDQLAAARAAIAAWNTAMTARMMRYWYVVYPLFAVFTVLFYGLAAGAQSFAYRSLVPLAIVSDDIAATG